jgi:hypothetical protein
VQKFRKIVTVAINHSTDWTQLARTRGLGIPAGQMEKIAPVMEALEKALAPLREQMPMETEPAPVFVPLSD